MVGLPGGRALDHRSNIVNSTSATPPSFTNTVNPNLVDKRGRRAVELQRLLLGDALRRRLGRLALRRTSAPPARRRAADAHGRSDRNRARRRAQRRRGPTAGRPVRYTITGANPGVRHGDDRGRRQRRRSPGRALKTGTDTLTAFVDRRWQRRAQREQRAAATATVTWGAAPPPPPPVPGKSVVVKVVSGQVFIKRPGSGRARQAGAPTKGFVPFTGAANIPVGSQLDTSKGRVALTSAADTGGQKTQTSDFYQGIFAVKQTRARRRSPRSPKPSSPTW